ncbi:MAG: 8-oxoguanine deaminase [Gammaproteobacteria bacterium]|nr:8-oxoguanine deaminase [Gammaproteobacteria bacterium]
MRTWIKSPLAIFSDQAKGGIVIENSRIAEIIGQGASPEKECDRIFDASEHVVLPGLINTHHHFYQTLTRACPPALNKKLFDWLEALYPIWARLTPDQLYDATRLALAELLLSGCTTASDHHYVFPQGLEEAVDIQIQAAREIGVRVTISRGSMNLSVEEGGQPPRSTVQDEDTILADCERVINAYHDPQDGSFLNIVLAPCSPFSVTESIMVETARLADEKNVGLHTHLAETEDEVHFCEQQYGCRPLDYLENTGWLSDRVWLAHGIHFSEDEIERLGRAGTSVSHCPGSNMLLASGICPALDLKQAGVPVGIGVDGSASEDASNLIQEVKQALLVQKLRYGAHKVNHLDVIQWATEGSAHCLGRQDIGKIEVGRQADLAMYKLDEPRFSGAWDPMAAIILCGAHRADRVMIAGEWRVVDGNIIDFDLQQLMAEHDQSAKALASNL